MAENELAGLLRYIKETTKENERDYFSEIVKSVNSCREQGKDRDVMKYYNSEEFYQEGKSDGIEEGKREVITNMLKEKMDEEIISRVTKRPIEYVLSVKEEMLAMVQEETAYKCEE